MDTTSIEPFKDVVERERMLRRLDACYTEVRDALGSFSASVKEGETQQMHEALVAFHYAQGAISVLGRLLVTVPPIAAGAPGLALPLREPYEGTRVEIPDALQPNDLVCLDAGVVRQLLTRVIESEAEVLMLRANISDTADALRTLVAPN